MTLDPSTCAPFFHTHKNATKLISTVQLSHRHVFNEESHDGAIQTVNGHHHQDDRLGKWPHLDISFTSAYMIIIIKVRYYITFPTPQKNFFLPPLVVVRGGGKFIILFFFSGVMQ